MAAGRHRLPRRERTRLREGPPAGVVIPCPRGPRAVHHNAHGRADAPLQPQVGRERGPAQQIRSQGEGVTVRESGFPGRKAFRLCLRHTVRHRNGNGAPVRTGSIPVQTVVARYPFGVESRDGVMVDCSVGRFLCRGMMIREQGQNEREDCRTQYGLPIASEQSPPQSLLSRDRRTVVFEIN